VRVSREVGISRIAAQAAAQGIRSDLPLVPALALGAASVTPLELTSAYAPFANGGTRVVPFLIERIEDPFGVVLWQRTSQPPVQVLSPADAFLVTSLLQTVVDRGTGRPVREAGLAGPIAGKTGTTNDGADVWFVGYTPTLVAGVWFGADRPQPLGWNASGGRLAAPTWARFLRDGWHSPTQDSAWAPPPGIETRQVDIGTGKLASDWCGPSRREYFKTGTVPATSCESEVQWSLRDLLPPDWHDANADADRLAAEQLGDAVETVLEATPAGERLRAVSSGILRVVRRATQAMPRERARDETRPRQPRTPNQPLPPPPPR
jgi:penicillin-binding protein 1A